MSEFYTPKKISSLMQLLAKGFVSLHGVKFKPNYEGLENLEEIVEKGGILLPNHGNRADIPTISKLLIDYKQIFPYYIMRDTLPFQQLLKELQGVPLKRPKDYPNERITDHNLLVFRGMAESVFQGNVWVYFPQGSRRSGLEIATKEKFVPFLYMNRYLKASGRDSEISLSAIKLDYEHKLDVDNSCFDVFVKVFPVIKSSSPSEIMDYWQSAMKS